MLNKRMVDRYEVTEAIRIGDTEIIIGINPKSIDLPYMVCTYTWDNVWGVEQIKDTQASNDYLEVMAEFLNRLQKQVSKIKAERDSRNLPLESLSFEHCIPNSNDISYENQIVVLKKPLLRPEYQTSEFQLFFANGGPGCVPASTSGKINCTEVYSGKDMVWQRHQLLGVIKSERVPEWAKKKIRELYKQQEKKKPDKGRDR